MIPLESTIHWLNTRQSLNLIGSYVRAVFLDDRVSWDWKIAATGSEPLKGHFLGWIDQSFGHGQPNNKSAHDRFLSALTVDSGNRRYKGLGGLYHLHMDKIRNQSFQFSPNDTRQAAIAVADLRKKCGDSGLHLTLQENNTRRVKTF